MDIEALLDHAKDTITVKRVFGEPIERNELLVIPVAVVVGGGGAGRSEGQTRPPGQGIRRRVQRVGATDRRLCRPRGTESSSGQRSTSLPCSCSARPICSAD